MKNSMEIPQKIKNRSTIWSSNSTSGYISKEYANKILRDICTPKFTATLFTKIHKIQKQPKHLSANEQMKVMWGVYYLVRREEEAETTWMNLRALC